MIFVNEELKNNMAFSCDSDRLLNLDLPRVLVYPNVRQLALFPDVPDDMMHDCFATKTFNDTL